MQLTAHSTLSLSQEQRQSLLKTLELANEACTFISASMFKSKVFNKIKFQKLFYKEIRSKFPKLSSQLVVRCIAKVADAYKISKDEEACFREHGAVPYDLRVLSWNIETMMVSIWTVDGRLKIPFRATEYHLRRLRGQRGQADLALQGNNFVLLTACEVEPLPAQKPVGFLGVDLGIVNIAADSDGELYGTGVSSTRVRYRKLREKLQKKGTKSAKRLLRKRRKKENRFAKDADHCISKKIVAKARDTGRGIALEDLKGIRDRVTVRRDQRATHHSWSFYQLRSFVSYKALLSGVPVVFVDPRNTSRECPACGHIAKANRQTQAKFKCRSCGHAGPADLIAAGNISRRAASTSLTRPFAS